MVHSWSVVRSCGLVHVSIVRAVNPVLALQATIGRAVTVFVGYEHRWMCIVEMASVVVRVHCK